MTELAHTHDSGTPCLACEVNHVRDGIATVSLADAKRAHAALRQLYAALATQQARIAELEAERGHLEEGARLFFLSEFSEHGIDYECVRPWMLAEIQRREANGQPDIVTVESAQEAVRIHLEYAADDKLQRLECHEASGMAMRPADIQWLEAERSRAKG